MRRPIARDQNQRKRAVSSQVLSWVNFTPASLSPALWLDAADIATITSSGSPAKVSQWDDKSGNGRNISQGTAAAQPVAQSTTQNGLNVISFSGAQVLTRASVTINQPYTVFQVWKYNTGLGPSDATVSFSMGELAAYAGYIGLIEYRIFNGTVLNSAAIADTNVHQITSLHNSAATASEIRLDGLRVAGPASSGATNGSRLNVGAANSSGLAGINGFVAEIIVVDRALTVPEIVVTENYLSAKWGTP